MAVTSADFEWDDEPQLGLATTRQLLEELVARFEIATPDDAVRMSLQHWLNQLPDDVLDYRTVDELPSDYGCAAGHRHRTFLAAAACDEEGGTIAPPPTPHAESVAVRVTDLHVLLRFFYGTQNGATSREWTAADRCAIALYGVPRVDEIVQHNDGSDS